MNRQYAVDFDEPVSVAVGGGISSGLGLAGRGLLLETSWVAVVDTTHSGGLEQPDKQRDAVATAVRVVKTPVPALPRPVRHRTICKFYIYVVR